MRLLNKIFDHVIKNATGCDRSYIFLESSCGNNLVLNFMLSGKVNENPATRRANCALAGLLAHRVTEWKEISARGSLRELK